MSYEKQTWETGEVITAEKLNHIEDGIAEGGGGNAGYECIEVLTEVFNSELTTASAGSFFLATFAPSQPLEGDSITVTLNDTDYTLPKVELGYGAFDSNHNPIFVNYPCAIGILNEQHYFFIPSAGTYSVKISALTKSVETSECFEKAVKSVSGGAPKYVKDASSDNGSVIMNLIGNNIPLGSCNRATGDFSHAEGGGVESEYGQVVYYPTTASGMGSHAEGSATTASGCYAHSEGGNTTASEFFSHAEGSSTTANGRGSHSEGFCTVASGDYSHAEGEYTEASSRSQHVFGKYNIAGSSFVEIVGNGENNESHSNARTLDWSGNESLQGSLTLGKGTADETTITAAQLKALLALLNA